MPPLRWPKIPPKWLFMAPNVLTWPQMALKHFPWVYYMILCHVGPPWGLFRGPLGPRWPLNRPQGGPIWHIIMYYAPAKCLRAILGHAGTFLVMKGYFGSWSFFIAPPFWVMNGHFWSWRAITGLLPSPCFYNFLARTTFVLESLPEAKNPGQDAFLGDFVFNSSYSRDNSLLD